MISFDTKPARVYYAYETTNHVIYDITTYEPTVTDEVGNYWYCYFDCTPYLRTGGMGEEPKYYRMCDANGVAFQSGNYNTTSTVSYLNDKGEKTAVVGATYYWSITGERHKIPQNAFELPYATTTDTEGNVTYYFLDSLIERGDTYAETTTTMRTTHFKPHEKKGSEVTKYVEMLPQLVKDNVSITNFVGTVNALPPCLTDSTATFYGCGGQYASPDLRVYGDVFMEKLNEYMKYNGDRIVEKYEDEKKDGFDTVVIETSIDDTHVGTITNTPTVIN